MEDQITLGDFVEVNGISGTVEGLTIRTVQIRGFRGELYTIHAGSITMVTNYSRNSRLSEQDALAGGGCLHSQGGPYPARHLRRRR